MSFPDLTDPLDLARERCHDCKPWTRWERRDVTPNIEAWLGLCDICASMQVIAPGAPDTMIGDPLAFFLLGPDYVSTAERPAWQRFYAQTLASPFSVPWHFQSQACETCQARTTVSTKMATFQWKRTLRLCLNCGFSAVATTHNISDGTPTLLSGGSWSPADPAIKTLRSSIFQTYRDFCARHEWRRHMPGEE